MADINSTGAPPSDRPDSPEHCRQEVTTCYRCAREYLRRARLARQFGGSDRGALYVRAVRMLRMAAAEWRRRAKLVTVAALVLFLGIQGSGYSQPASVEVRRMDDGRTGWLVYLDLDLTRRFAALTQEQAQQFRRDVEAYVAERLKNVCPAGWYFDTEDGPIIVDDHQLRAVGFCR